MLESTPGSSCVRAENPSAKLEEVFAHIAATRMTGVGLLNPALAVEAVGFRSWRGDWVGVLITPWFMNLICLPGPDAAWEAQSSGSKRDVELPAGSYEFLAADEDELGAYLTSSLFSPMFEFADMDGARAVAQAVLEELFTPAVPQPAPPQAPEGLSAKLEYPEGHKQPVSRRGFFGALLRPGDGD